MVGFGTAGVWFAVDEPVAWVWIEMGPAEPEAVFCAEMGSGQVLTGVSDC